MNPFNMTTLMQSPTQRIANRSDCVSEPALKTGICSPRITSPVLYKLKIIGVFLAALICSITEAAGPNSPTSPQGAKVVQGSATVSSFANTTTINQNSQNTSINWDSFNIGVGQNVNFIQPNSSAIALNRVVGASPSSIFGNLNANGKVFLINPNGILFAPSASVNVGGLVAATLSLSDQNFMSGKYSFSGNGQGSVINQGAITASDGAYVALLGAQVNNTGTINAKLGSVALASGEAMTLTLGDGLLSVKIDTGAANALVQNGGVIQTDGGNVLLTTQAAGNLLQTAVNNTGTIQAQTVENRNGTIRLLGDMQSGTVNVAGKLDASAPKNGNGGFIETSAAHVKVANGTKITTAAPFGKQGTWLIDPDDYNIAASGGDITGAELSTLLGSTSVEISTMGSCTSTGTCKLPLGSSSPDTSPGNINVNDLVAWSANKLTLNASGDININAPLVGSGTASLFFQYGQGGTGNYYVNAPITLPSNLSPSADSFSFATQQGYDSSPIYYTVIASPAALLSQLSTTQTSTSLAGYYALGANINASSLIASSLGAFIPIGTSSLPFTGVFEGLGNKISNLTINSAQTDVGLFGYSSGKIQNVGLVAPIISSSSSDSSASVGAVAGTNAGSINNSFVVACTSSTCTNSASVSSSSAVNIGGLVGTNTGTITNSFTNIPVISTNSVLDNVGGLVGYNKDGVINSSFALGSVTGTDLVGGLVGQNLSTDSDGTASTGLISQAYATGAVTASSTGTAGGLVGQNSGYISYSYAKGEVSGNVVGGLVGINQLNNNGYGGSIQYTYAAGAVTASDTGFAGGLVGINDGGNIDSSYATGNVAVNQTTSGSGYAGGLIGWNTNSSLYVDPTSGLPIGGTYTNSYASGTVTAGISSGIRDSLVALDDTSCSTCVATNSTTTMNDLGASASTFVNFNLTDVLLYMPLRFFANSDSKIYNGSTAASSGAAPTVMGLQTSSEVTTQTQQFTSKNAGSNLTSVITTFSALDSDTSSSSSAAYVIGTSSDSTGTITTFHAAPPFISMAHSESESESANVHETNTIHADANDVHVDPVSGRGLPNNERVVEALPFSTAIGAGVKMPAGLAVRYDRQAAR